MSPTPTTKLATHRTTGTVANPFGYAGQYTDPESGLQYLRARYYEPTTGQFLTKDPLAASTGDPYGYAAQSPLNATDATGLECNSDSWVHPSDWGDCASDGLENAKEDVVDDVSHLLTAKGLVTFVVESTLGSAVGFVCVAAIGETGVGVPVCAVAAYATKRGVKAAIDWAWDEFDIPNPSLIDAANDGWTSLTDQWNKIRDAFNSPFQTAIAARKPC